MPKKIQYFSGNSYVELTKGIIHLYKEKYFTTFITKFITNGMQFTVIN